MKHRKELIDEFMGNKKESDNLAREDEKKSSHEVSLSQSYLSCSHPQCGHHNCPVVNKQLLIHEKEDSDIVCSVASGPNRRASRT